MNIVKTAILTLCAVAGMTVMASPLVGAQAPSPAAPAASSPTSQAQQGVNDIGGTGAANINLGDKIKSVVNLLLYIIGIAAVIVIVIAGLMYVVSSGDANKTKAAKDAILYAVVGLVVAILAFAIVNFVIGAFTPKS
jgi:hypothetical protein